MSEFGTTKYQLFIKGVRGDNISIVVHKVRRRYLYVPVANGFAVQSDVQFSYIAATMS